MMQIRDRVAGPARSSRRRATPGPVPWLQHVIPTACILLAASTSAEEARRTARPIVYGPPQQIATLANEQINESSGLAASRKQSGLFWTHNDSGDRPRIFAFDMNGKDRGEFDLPKTKANDWEDMASVTLDGQPLLILGDVGDNARRRDDCSLYLLAEPTRRDKSIEVRQIRFRYQDGPRDCEAIAVDPVGKHVFLATKAVAVHSPIYRLDLPDGEADALLVARRIGNVPLPLITGMDMTSDGRRAILVTYGDAYEFQRQGDETWRDAFTRPPRAIRMPRRRQGEAICYGPDDQTLYLTSERLPTPLWRVGPEAAP